MLLQAIKNYSVLVHFQIGLSSLLSIQIRDVLWQNHFSIENVFLPRPRIYFEKAPRYFQTTLFNS